MRTRERSAPRAAAKLYLGALRGQRKAIIVLGLWSIVEGLPAPLSGRLAVDDGFAAGNASLGAAWLGAYAAVSLLGAVAARGIYGRLGAIVEPMRDALVTVVVHGVLHENPSAADRPDTAAVARITRHIEVVRDVTAGLLIQARGLAVTTIAALVGLVGTATALAPLVLGPIVLALVLGAGLLRTLARRQREVVLADERCAELGSTVYIGLRDLVSCGAQAWARRWVGTAVIRQETAAVRLGNASALRELITSLGALVPLLLVLGFAPAMVTDGRLTVGAVLGAVVYLTTQAQPALIGLGQTAGSTVLWLVVTLRRLAELAAPPSAASSRSGRTRRHLRLGPRGATHCRGLRPRSRHRQQPCRRRGQRHREVDPRRPADRPAPPATGPDLACRHPRRRAHRGPAAPVDRDDSAAGVRLRRDHPGKPRAARRQPE